MTLPHKLVRFLAIGIVSTGAYLALYTILRTVTDAPWSNLIALVVTTIGNTAANRRLTFGIRGRNGLAADHLAGLLAFAVALAITTAALVGLRIVAPGAGPVIEIIVLVGANIVATVVRFVLLRLRFERSTWGDTPRATAEGTVR